MNFQSPDAAKAAVEALHRKDLRDPEEAGEDGGVQGKEGKREMLGDSKTWSLKTLGWGGGTMRGPGMDD